MNTTIIYPYLTLGPLLLSLLWFQAMTSNGQPRHVAPWPPPSISSFPPSAVVEPYRLPCFWQRDSTISKVDHVPPQHLLVVFVLLPLVVRTIARNASLHKRGMMVLRRASTISPSLRYLEVPTIFMNSSIYDPLDGASTTILSRATLHWFAL